MVVRAFIDADTLYKRHVRNALVWQALGGVCELHWSLGVLDEARKHLIERNLERYGEERAEKVDQILSVVTQALSKADAGREVSEAEIDAVIDDMNNDEKDRHVLAGAVAAGASVVITSNKKDFKQEHTEPHGVRAMTADEFLVGQLSKDTLDAVTVALRLQGDYLPDGYSLPKVLTLLGTPGKSPARPAFLPEFVERYEALSGIARDPDS